MLQNRLDTNPALGSRKLKLGTFQTNLDSGCVMSGLDGRLDITWPNTVALAKLADEMEFEAIVPVARWRGFGGANNPQGPGFETYTWAAGIAASTAKSGVISTSHISLVHPLIAAKQCTVIDHISNGRFMLNVVCGWNGPEMDMLDVPLMRHEDRYACAEEWLGIIRRLWTEDEEFDHEGRFYQVKKGYLQPKPIQKPCPPVMNAGASERGRHFAAKNCDLAFTLLEVVEDRQDLRECDCGDDARDPSGDDRNLRCRDRGDRTERRAGSRDRRLPPAVLRLGARHRRVERMQLDRRQRLGG